MHLRQFTRLWDKHAMDVERQRVLKFRANQGSVCLSICLYEGSEWWCCCLPAYIITAPLLIHNAVCPLDAVRTVVVSM